MKIPITQIEPNAKQPRKTLIGLEELAESIRQLGLLEPIMVRPLTDGRYGIIHGERRWRAAKLAGLNHIEAVIRQVTDQEAYEIGLVENVNREDLSPMEQAWAFEQLQRLGHTQQAIATLIGKGQSYVAHKLRLLRLPEPITFYLQHGALTENHIRQIAKLENIYGGDLLRGFPPDLDLGRRINDADGAATLLVLIRPEERVIWLKPTGMDTVITACQHFADYVSKHNSSVQQWKVAGFWWASLTVMLELTVADLTLALERWQERYEDSLLMWRTVYHDYQPSKKGYLELYWAVYADLRHSGSLPKWKDRDKLNAAERREYMTLLAKVINKGSWALPSTIQAKEAGEIEQYLNPADMPTM